MSKENKKEKFFCIANCLPVKSKTARNHKNGSKRPFKDENDDPECESIADSCSVEARMTHTRQWLQNLSTNANFDRNSNVLVSDSQIETSQEDKKGSINDDSNYKRNSLNDSTVKPKLDSTISSTGTLKDNGTSKAADESALTSVSKCQHRRWRKSKRKLPGYPDADGLSVASSCVSLATEMVTIQLDTSKSLGITIVGHANGSQGDCGIFIGCVKKGGAAEETGKVEPGDLIVEVNGIDLESKSNDNALAILKQEMSKQGMLTLVLAKYWDLDECEGAAGGTNYTDMYEFGSIFGYGSREGTLARNPMPPHLTDDNRAPRRRRFEETFDAHSSRMDCFGRPPSAIMPHGPYYHPPPSYPSRPGYLPVPPSYVDLGYHDPRKYASALPQYGFQSSGGRLQSRRPLLGSELIGWIQSTVPGMSARNEARGYAQMLMDTGFLSGTERRFHEDGWYALISDKPLPPPPTFY